MAANLHAAGGFSGFDKRSNSLIGAGGEECRVHKSTPKPVMCFTGFSGFDKRSAFSGAGGMSGFEKRAAYLGAGGLSGFEKRHT